MAEWIGPGVLLALFIVGTLINSFSNNHEEVDESKTRRYK